MGIQWNHKIFNSKAADFEAVSLEIFHYQYANNKVYQQYVQALGIKPESVFTLQQIPFLPIRFFKSHPVITGEFEAETIFESSGTTGTRNSRHFVKDVSLYRESFMKGFENRYGSISDYCIIGLLPSYLEKGNSSLVYMVKELIEKSRHTESGFYLQEHKKLAATLQGLEQKKQKTIVIGVTYALLDFAEQFPMPLESTIIMETGGMKGRRVEMVRPEVHQLLTTAFGVSAIHAEYGMTELFSQAYSSGEGIFHCPDWMRIFMRDEEDPFTIKTNGAGAINCIDLANIHSCSFIATDDVGKLNADGSFEVGGRMDGSDLRGCSLMVV